MSPDRVADLLDSVLSLPLHRSLGLRLRRPGDPAGGLELGVTEAVVNPSGVLHGGLVPLVLDVTCFLALAPDLPDDAGAVTVSSTVSILAPARPGESVVSSAHVDRLGRRVAFVSAQLHAGDRLLATGQVVKSVT